MFNESFFFAIASGLFIILAFKYAKSFIMSVIEGRIQTIHDKLDEALLISKESEKLLKEYQDLYNSSQKMTKDLSASTKSEIAQLKLQAEQEIESKLQHKTEIIVNKIRFNELKLLSAMRLESVQLAIKTSIIILNSYKNKLQDGFVEEAISTFSAHFKENITH